MKTRWFLESTSFPISGGVPAQSATSTLPLATTVGGVQLLADGQPLPLLSVAPADIVFQVPWDMQGTHTLTLAPTPSPFEEPHSRGLQIQPSAPEFWRTADGFPVIAHQDFHGLVTASDPAHPDEILHFYLTGGRCDAHGRHWPACSPGAAFVPERPVVRVLGGATADQFSHEPHGSFRRSRTGPGGSGTDGRASAARGAGATRRVDSGRFGRHLGHVPGCAVTASTGRVDVLPNPHSPAPGAHHLLS
jgi:uncharacterized protein (TIGR03437 family)